MQEPYYRRQGKPGSPEGVVLRIDGIIIRSGKIGAFQVGMLKCGTKQVALIHYGISKIGFGEVDFFERAVYEDGVIQFYLVKGRVIQLAILKTDGQPDLVAMIKMQAQHFTFFEGCFPNGGLGHFHIAQITSRKGAFHETDPAEIGPCKIAIPEAAVFIFAFGQGFFRVVLPGEKLLFHDLRFHPTKYNEISGM